LHDKLFHHELMINRCVCRAAEWAQRRRRDKLARQPDLLNESERGNSVKPSSASARPSTSGAGEPVKIVTGKKKRRAAGKYDQLVETRKALQVNIIFEPIKKKFLSWRNEVCLYDNRKSYCM